MGTGGDISVNRKALRDFHIFARYEAGIVLKGTEVKSMLPLESRMISTEGVDTG